MEKYYEDKYNELLDQCADIRDLIPIVVNYTPTDSMVTSPTEVLYFAEIYIKQLQEEIEELKGSN